MKNIYCHQIGMLIDLSYCAVTNEGFPCRNIIGCWKERMDVISFLREKYSDKELKDIFCSPPKSRIDRIIESAKKID